MSDSPFLDRNSPYERPNQPWQCGRLCKGKPCDEGPRPDGKCSQSEDPCRPVRTLRWKRGALTMACVLFSVVIVSMVLFSSDLRDPFIYPGAVSVHHAHLMAQNSKTCASCHSKSDKGILSTAFHQDPMKDSGLCIDCHFQKTSHEQALRPHGVKDVTAFPEEVRGKFASKHACATCHHEHKGFVASIKDISDRKCQSCHANVFESFEKGHPEFKSFPQLRVRRLPFNHQRAEHRELDCLSCHVPNATQQNYALIPFDKSCAGCHTPDVHGKETLLAFQMKGPAAMKASDITSFAKILDPSLAQVKAGGDSFDVYMQVRKTIHELKEGVVSSKSELKGKAYKSVFGTLTTDKISSFLDIDNVQKDEIQLGYYLLAKTKGMRGVEAIKWIVADKLRTFLKKNGKGTSAQLDMFRLIAGMSDRQPSDFLQLLELLLKEPKIEEKYENLATHGVFKKMKLIEIQNALSADSHEKLSAAEHKALHALYALLKKSEVEGIWKMAMSKAPKYKGSFQEKKLFASIAKLYPNTPDKFKNADTKTFFTEFFQKGRKWSGSKAWKKEKIEKKALGVLKKSDKKLYKKFKKGFKGKDNVVAVVGAMQKSLSKMLKTMRFEDPLPSWKDGLKSRTGHVKTDSLFMEHPHSHNWIIDPEKRTLSYKSRGHKDEVLRTLYELHMDDQSGRVDALALPKVGDCRKCHIASPKKFEDTIKSPFVLNREKPKRLFKFNHLPHTQLKCVECHDNQKAVAVPTSHPHIIRDFSPLKKASCLQCHHHQDKAEVSCLQCHNYHADDLSEQKQHRSFFQAILEKREEPSSLFD